ncbi:MAG: ribosome biogenesis GTPase Der [Alphaproteobacteria bacterium]
MALTVAIVGRPNVGKSTLFNRLAGKKLAIVGAAPGVTRDRVTADANVGGLALHLIDTAGYERSARGSLQARMVEQTERALAHADICLFLIDAREGVLPADEIVAGALHKGDKPVILVANKSEKNALPGHTEGFRLGFGEPVAVSAEHGIGIGELVEALEPFAGEPEPADETAEAIRPLRLAIVGRPNVGKSSLFNRLIGEERALTGPEAGITRDPVAARWEWNGRQILVHDTAGLRKKAHTGEKLEKLSVESTLNAVRFADCVIVVIDATQPFEKQDLAIADLIEREGRAVVFAVNKWDLAVDKKRAAADLRQRVDRLLPQLAGAFLVPVSALTGEGMAALMPAVAEADRVWNSRVPTPDLNRFLQEAVSRHPPPAVRGRAIRIRYMTQPKARPPTYVLFGNQLRALPEAWLRYLANALRDAFGLPGTPIRFTLRTSENPYARKRKK